MSSIAISKTAGLSGRPQRTSPVVNKDYERRGVPDGFDQFSGAADSARGRLNVDQRLRGRGAGSAEQGTDVAAGAADLCSAENVEGRVVMSTRTARWSAEA